MKLSEAIRAGACLTDPMTHQLISSDGTHSCALGAALIGFFGLSAARKAKPSSLSHVISRLDARAIWTANDGRFRLRKTKHGLSIDDSRSVPEGADVRLLIAEDLEREGL